MSRAPGLGLRLLGAGAALAATCDGALALWRPVGLSTLGRPPWLALAWALAGLATALVVMTAQDRRRVAGCLTALLLAATPFGLGALPGSPGALLPLAGAALVAAAPWIRPSFGALATGAALALALPACLGSHHPLGAVQWAATVVPPASLVLLLPAAFPGAAAATAALVLLASTACLLAASLSDYLSLMHTLGLSLPEALVTRLRPMGQHPNLAAPSVMVALLLGAALSWGGQRRRLVLLLLVPVFLALAAMQSKTGTAVAVAGLGALLALRARWPLARLVRPVLAVGLVAALLVPATGITDSTITERSSSMVSKAVSFRSSMWELGRDAFAAAPFVGNGPYTTYLQGAVASAGRYDGLPKDDHPHNVVLAVGGALGIPGLIGLALLLAAGLRRRPGQGLVADAALVAAALHWAANGVDMGGAVTTLYPASVLALLGLAQAARADGAPAPASQPAPRWPRALPASGVLAVLIGAALLTQEQLVSRADRALAPSRVAADAADATDTTDTTDAVDTADTADATVATERARALSDLAAALLPLDPRPWGQRAALAAHAGDTAAQLEALEQALARAPDQAGVLHAAALTRSRLDLDDPQVPQLLQRALALDPYGPQAWSRHVDAAMLAAHHGDEGAAREHMLTAVLLNPGAATRAGWVASRRALRLSADGRRAVELPLDRLFADLQQRRDELAGIDPAYDARLRLREVDVLLALGLLDDAERTCRELLADEPGLLETRLGQIELQRGDPRAAAPYMAASGRMGIFAPLAQSLQAMAQVLEPDDPAFEQSLADALATVADVGFETASMIKLMDAQRIMAARRGQPEREAHWREAVEFLER